MTTWTDRILDVLGFTVRPHFHDVRVHDVPNREAMNREAIAMVALHVVAKCTEGTMQAIIADQRTDDRPQAQRKDLESRRSIKAEVARRADRWPPFIA